MTAWTDDIGGGYHDRWDGIIDNKCPECGAEPKQKCWNKLSDKAKHMPCWKRSKVTA